MNPLAHVDASTEDTATTNPDDSTELDESFEEQFLHLPTDQDAALSQVLPTVCSLQPYSIILCFIVI